MLLEIVIKNFVLIENLNVSLGRGLTAFTGETGAGKSIVVDALGLLLGDRAGASWVRKGAKTCEVSAAFDIGKNAPAKAFLKSLSLLSGDEEESLVLRREIDVQGKSRIYVNDRPAGVSVLSDLGELLVDIHGQNEHQRLLKTARQRDLLDRYAGSESLCRAVAESYGQWKSLLKVRQESQLSEKEKNQKIDLYRFQVQEIEAAALREGEEEEIERVLPQIKNAEKLSGFAAELYGHLYESESSVPERLGKSLKALDAMETLGADMPEVRTLLEEARMRTEEALRAVERFRDGLESDPQKLDALISRQDLIDKLKRKYGATVADVLAHGAQTRAELALLENHSQSLAELDGKIKAAEAEVLKQGRKLSAARRKGAESLSREVLKELKDLGFPKGRFEVCLTAEKDEAGKETPTASGLERAEFLFCANPGEDLQPLKNVASGGELSRVMLALKRILASADEVPTLVFDEVDAGIGGSMGHAIGEKLRSLSRSHQILAITHLPQIAAYAHAHIAIRKTVAGETTRTVGEILESETRVREIARMLGGIAGEGQEPTRASLKHASELLSQAK